MALIQITDLTFAYPGSFDNVFEHVSFQFDTDWRLGLTGRNGRGKTTLLRLLQGQYPHQGTITAPGGFEYFPYPVPDASLTPLELLERSFPDVPEWRFRRELTPLAVTEDALYRSFSTLSGGEQAKLLLALLFAREGRYLLIDEPTNHLDETGRALVSRYLAKKSGFLLVSHDRAFLDGCVDHILSIGRSSIEVQRGNFSSWYENKQRQDAFELAQNAQLKKEIGRLKQAARQSRAWADKVENTKIGPHSAKVTGEADAMGGRAYIGEQSRRMQQRRKNLERRQNAAIEEKSALLKNIEQAAPLKLHQLPYHTNRLALLRNVSVCYGDVPVCSGVTFSVEQGDRIALRGANGTGKTSLLRLLCGEDVPHTGTVECGSRLQFPMCSRTHPVCGAIFPPMPRSMGWTRVCSRRSCASWTLHGCSLKRTWRTFPPGRRKRFCWRGACANRRTCLSGTSRSTMWMCSHAFSWKSCCWNSSRRSFSSSTTVCSATALRQRP